MPVTLLNSLGVSVRNYDGSDRAGARCGGNREGGRQHLVEPGATWAAGDPTRRRRYAIEDSRHRRHTDGIRQEAEHRLVVERISNVDKCLPLRLDIGGKYLCYYSARHRQLVEITDPAEDRSRWNCLSCGRAACKLVPCPCAGDSPYPGTFLSIGVSRLRARTASARGPSRCSWRAFSTNAASSLDHQHGAGCQAHEPLGRAADDLLVEPRMAHEPDYKQFEMLFVDQRDDGMDRMTGKQVGLEHSPRHRLETGLHVRIVL